MNTPKVTYNKKTPYEKKTQGTWIEESTKGNLP